MPSGQSVTCHRIASLAAATAVALATAVAGSPAAGAPSYTMEERAAAIASPSMVYLESTVTGYLRRTDTGEALQAQPFTLNYRCSGFVVSAQGHVVTSGHCLQPGKGSYRNSAANLLAADRIKAGTLLAAQKDAFVADVNKTTDFVGENLVSAPTVKVYGQLFQGQGALRTDPAWLAESVQSLPANKGDITLIKFPATGAPVAELSSAQPAAGAAVVPIGFKPDSTSSSATYTVISLAAKIIGPYGSASPTLYEMDQDLGPVTRGGMVVDPEGRVVGLINADVSTKDRPNRILSNTDSLRTALSESSATNALGPTDQAYRSGLNAYFAGRYTEAIKTLDGVIATAPQHSMARTYRSHAAERLAVEGDSSVGIPWWVWVVAGLGLVFLICVVVFVILIRKLRRQRDRPDPYAMATTYPVMPLPTSGAGTTYPMPTSGAGTTYPVMPISGAGTTYEYLPVPGPQQLPGSSADQQQTFAFPPENDYSAGGPQVPPSTQQTYDYQDYWASPPPPPSER